MDERLQFVARRLAGEPMAELCREFGIARKTGYKIFDRYQECGLEGQKKYKIHMSLIRCRIGATPSLLACEFCTQYCTQVRSLGRSALLL